MPEDWTSVVINVFLFPGKYLYTEATGFTYRDVATMISPPVYFSDHEEHCLSFYFHAKGRDIDTIAVYRYYDNGNKYIIGHEKYNKGDR